MTALFDSHCHLDFDDFSADRSAVISAAAEAGVGAIMVPGVSRQHSLNQPTLESSELELFRGFGLHPYFIQQHQHSDIAWLQQQLTQHPAAVVGETGLDKSCPDYAKQMQLLIAQIELACHFKRPLILHHRHSQPDLIAILRRYRSQLPDHPGVIHAFSGSYEQAQLWLDLGFMIGVGGLISYARAQKTRATIARLPLAALLLETDAPAMPLAGFQGQRNQPAQLPLVSAQLAELTRQPEAVVAAQTTSNAYQLFAARLLPNR
ncbi:MAG: putative metal-dependent hydrolase YjjV [Pseudidiomarina mangrovi]|nr:MAG: putative metal-dependent hydrolase YjjV [Pseudidiomarina mangrovi]